MSSFDPQYRQENVAGGLTMMLYRVSQAIALLLREKAQANGLSSTQLQAVLFLAYARPDTCTIGGLAERLGCTPATASGVVDALERKGLAVRQPWEEHGRTTLVRLTDAGTAMAVQVDDSLAELEAVVAGLPEQAQSALLDAVNDIAHSFVEQGRIKLYGICWQCCHFQPDAHPDEPDRPHRCTLMEKPVSRADSYTECPDCKRRDEKRQAG